MSHELIIQPDHGIEAVLNRIDAATKSLRLKQFTLTDTRVLKALAAAQQRNVDVRVLLNAARPDLTRDNDASHADLERAGIAVQWTNPAFYVSHEKSIVFDDASALIATFNLAPKYFGETRDYGIITHEPNEVQEILRCFEADWDRTEFIPGQTPLVWSNVDARTKMVHHIDRAQTHLQIQHPKFVDLIILERILEAHMRGVKVKVLSAGTHGVRGYDLAETFASLRVMQKLGIKVLRMKVPKLHAKLIIADRAVAFTGSMNVHRRAFDERRELGIVIREPAIVDQLVDVFRADWKAAHDWEVPDPLNYDLHSDPNDDIGD